MTTYKIIVEHTLGQSVSHPCWDGVYDDPTDQVPSIISAECESDAEDGIRELLAKIVGESNPCGCHRRYAPGSDAWWESVTITLIPQETVPQ